MNCDELATTTETRVRYHARQKWPGCDMVARFGSWETWEEAVAAVADLPSWADGTDIWIVRVTRTTTVTHLEEIV